MKNYVLALGLILSCGFISQHAQAEDILTTDQINSLKIERRQLIDARDEAIQAIVTNEKKIEIFMDWVNGKNPSVIKNKVAPAAAAALAGSAGSFALYKDILASFIAKLPASMQKVAKFSPLVTGAIIAAIIAQDSLEYDSLVKELKLNSTKEQYQAYYDQLLADRNHLADEIVILSKQINALDNTLKMYN